MSLTPHELMQFANRAYTEQTLCVDDVELLITEHGDTTVFAWRGTEAGGIGQVLKLFKTGNWRDILRDLRALPWYDKRVGWAHAGFLKGARGVLDKCIADHPYGRPIIHVGHSLGGALAQIAAVYMHSLGFRIARCAAFGSPNVFLSRSVGRIADIDLTLYRNGNDIVTTMPGVFFPYVPATKYTQIGPAHNPARGGNFGHHVRAMYLAAVKEVGNGR